MIWIYFIGLIVYAAGFFSLAADRTPGVATLLVIAVGWAILIASYVASILQTPPRPVANTYSPPEVIRYSSILLALFASLYVVADLAMALPL